MTELEEYMEISFTDKIAHVLEQAIYLQFPLIKDLKIGNDNGILNVSFTTGATKQEVEEFLTELRK
jgi:hypothetical protein